MPRLDFAEEIQFVNVLAHADIVATATPTKYVKFTNVGAGQVEFEVNFGTVTSTDSTGEVIVTLVGNDVNDTSSSDNNEVAVAFNYRLSSAVGTDSMGAITAATSAGYALPNTSDNTTLLIYADPDVIQQKYARLVITPTSETTACVVGANARFIPRKAQHSLASST